MTDRHEWIRRRRAGGYDFGELVEAMSKIVVASAAGGHLILDASALTTDPNDVTHWLLTHVGEGVWRLPITGEEGPLPEMLMTCALFYLPRWSPGKESGND